MNIQLNNIEIEIISEALNIYSESYSTHPCDSAKADNILKKLEDAIIAERVKNNT